MAHTEPKPYVLAARFTDEQSSGKAYSEAEDLTFNSNGDLSVYRLQLNNFWYVGVVGIAPSEDLDRQLRQALSVGQRLEHPTKSEANMLDFLWQRRAESMIPGAWVEHHYRPGQRVPMPKFSLGHIVMTRGVEQAIGNHPEGKGMEELYKIIFSRHVQGDWGDLDQHDVQVNQEALQSGERLFSTYQLADGTKIYVITEGDRSVTTALLPSEY